MAQHLVQQHNVVSVPTLAPLQLARLKSRISTLNLTQVRSAFIRDMKERWGNIHLKDKKNRSALDYIVQHSNLQKPA